MHKLIMALAATVVLGLTGPAVAQDKKVAIPTKIFYKGQQAGQTFAKDRLIGRSVVNKDGQVIGDIEDLILKDDQIEGVILGVGGFLGVGEKKIGVRYIALEFATENGKTVIRLPAATKAVIQALEPYKRAEPKRSILEKAGEKAKELSDKTKETVKDAYGAAKEKSIEAYDKAKEAIKPTPAPAQAPATQTPAPAPAAPKQ